MDLTQDSYPMGTGSSFLGRQNDSDINLMPKLRKRVYFRPLYAVMWFLNTGTAFTFTVNKDPAWVEAYCNSLFNKSVMNDALTNEADKS
jgi:hypothetical protein